MRRTILAGLVVAALLSGCGPVAEPDGGGGQLTGVEQELDAITREFDAPAG
ncbi:MAG: hypothetical protein L0H84_15980 [Pseudonocardia sp.]|nr:hypothetical protein [Pseudonocardia sp.]